MDSSFQRTTSEWLPERLTPVLAPSVNVSRDFFEKKLNVA